MLGVGGGQKWEEQTGRSREEEMKQRKWGGTAKTKSNLRVHKGN